MRLNPEVSIVLFELINGYPLPWPPIMPQHCASFTPICSIGGLRTYSRTCVSTMSIAAPNKLKSGPKFPVQDRSEEQDIIDPGHGQCTYQDSSRSCSSDWAHHPSNCPRDSPRCLYRHPLINRSLPTETQRWMVEKSQKTQPEP